MCGMVALALGRKTCNELELGGGLASAKGMLTSPKSGGPPKAEQFDDDDDKKDDAGRAFFPLEDCL